MGRFDSRCFFCTERRIGDYILKKIGGNSMFGKGKKKGIIEEKKVYNPREPKLVIIREEKKSPDKYVCPKCKQENLVYNEEEGLFICKCKAKYGLMQVD